MQPNPGVPYEIPDDEEDESAGELSPDDPLFKHVDTVIYGESPEDGLLGRTDEEHGTATWADPRVQDWQLHAPDDPKGELIQARIQAALAKKMDHLIQRTRGEVWATRSDFLREALFHYIRSVLISLQADDPVLTTLFLETDMAGRAAFHASRRARLERTTDSIRSYLTDLANLDDHEEAHRFLIELAGRIRRMRVRSWRRHVLLSVNGLPILQVTCRMLDSNGWDLPVEFYPAMGKSPK